MRAGEDYDATGAKALLGRRRVSRRLETAAPPAESRGLPQREKKEKRKTTQEPTCTRGRCVAPPALMSLGLDTQRSPAELSWGVPTALSDPHKERTAVFRGAGRTEGRAQKSAGLKTGHYRSKERPASEGGSIKVNSREKPQGSKTRPGQQQKQHRWKYDYGRTEGATFLRKPAELGAVLLLRVRTPDQTS